MECSSLMTKQVISGKSLIRRMSDRGSKIKKHFQVDMEAPGLISFTANLGRWADGIFSNSSQK